MQTQRGVGGGIRRPEDAEQRTFLVGFVEVVVWTERCHGGVISGASHRVIKDNLLRLFGLRVWFQGSAASASAGNPGPHWAFAAGGSGNPAAGRAPRSWTWCESSGRWHLPRPPAASSWGPDSCRTGR